MTEPEPTQDPSAADAPEHDVAPQGERDEAPQSALDASTDPDAEGSNEMGNQDASGPPEPMAGNARAPSEDHGDDEAPDEFGAARERVADPDDWEVRSRTAEAEPERHSLSAEESALAARFRRYTHIGAAASATLLILTLAVHFLDLGPAGLPTWIVTLAGASAMAAVYCFPRGRFAYPPLDGDVEDLQRRKHVRTLVLRAFGVAFGLSFALLALLDFLALLVAVQVIADLSQSGLTLARNFILIPVLAIGLAVAAVYTRMRIPSDAPPYPHEDKVFWTLGGVFAGASLIAGFFALGLPAVVRWTGIEARQSIYILGVAVGMTIAFANLYLRIPDAYRIIRAEVEQAKQADRARAQDLQKRMMRNYILALLFVVGSIGFLVGKAAGFVTTGGGGGLDVILIFYVGFGLVFLAIILTNYYQIKQMRGRVVVGKKGETGLGKRRYTPDQITRLTILGVSGFFTLSFLVMMLLVGSGRLESLFGIPVTKRAGTDLFVFAALSAIGPYGFYHMRETARMRGIDEKFPDFLRDLAESQRSGMTLPRALITASKGVYGPLTKEIQIMAAQVEWGVSFDDALGRFAERTRTPLIQRTVSLVREAAASGGNVVDVLSAASDDAREIRNIMSERKAQMGVYSLIVYIAFGVFLTVIAVLNSQFIPELARSTSQVSGTSLGGIQFGDIDVPAYQQLFFHAALIQGLGGGLVSGVMTEGHPLSGLRHSFIMTAAAYGVFRFLIL